MDDKVLAFFNAIAENWLKQDVLLTFEFQSLNNNNQLVRTANYGQLKALMQLLNNRSVLDDGDAINANYNEKPVIPCTIAKIGFA